METLLRKQELSLVAIKNTEYKSSDVKTNKLTKKQPIKFIVLLCTLLIQIVMEILQISSFTVGTNKPKPWFSSARRDHLLLLCHSFLLDFSFPLVVDVEVLLSEFNVSAVLG